MQKRGREGEGLATRAVIGLVQTNRATRGAVFAEVGEHRVVLVASEGSIGNDLILTVQTVWGRYRQRLADGKAFAVGEEAWAILPVHSNGRMIGAVYLDNIDPLLCPEQLRERYLSIAAQGIAESDRAVGPQLWAPLLDAVPVDDLKKQELLLALETDEWNISRVARHFAVTRLTIYKRMRRFGIPRRKPGKA